MHVALHNIPVCRTARHMEVSDLRLQFKHAKMHRGGLMIWSCVNMQAQGVK